ncbi:MAG: hypothetical protein CL878_03665 [Dehalococcoidia bacterium]|nr:hypothetical protein [Dehalococcoidia bacterium]
MGNWRWTRPRATACRLVAQGQRTHTEIIAHLGVKRSTFYSWLRNAQFRERLDDYRRKLNEQARHLAIAEPLRRVEALHERRERLLLVVDERAAEYREIRAQEPDRYPPDGATGLFMRTVKQIGTGDQAQIVEQFALDVGLLRELRELEKQAAIELHQWQQDEYTDSRPLGKVPIREIIIERPARLLPAPGAPADAA